MIRFKSLRLLSFSMLTACGSLIPQSIPKDVFILASKQEIFCDSSKLNATQINVKEQDSPDFFRTQKIIFRKDSKLGSYQFAEWSEAVTLRIERLISESLRCKGFQISNSSDSINQSAVSIKFAVLDFSHEASTQPGKFKGTFRVTKIKDAEVSEKLFSIESELITYDAEGARKAADVVVEQLLKKVIEFAA